MSAETEALVSQIAALSGAPLSRHLRDVLLPIQRSRGDAYARLNAALRPSAAGREGRADGDGYAATCANVAEDLKVASEGVIALRAHAERRSGADAEAVVALLDRIQALEEQKMVAFVSLHALKRSGKVARASNIARDENEDKGERALAESYEEKVVRFSKSLSSIDQQIADLTDEAREMVADDEELEEQSK